MQAVAVPARIDVDNAMQVLAALRDAARGSAPVALDLSPLREFDSSALSLLLQLARARNGAGADNSRRGDASTLAQDVASGGTGAAPAPSTHWPLFLLNPPDKLRELAELYGVAQMLFGTPGAAGRQASQA